jgi:lipopolysaccharide/colanic/teichoic acid biosynthesis glycosyltransferase
VKRLLDVVAAGLGLVALFPFMFVIALVIFVEDGGSPFFRQVRVGKGGRTFEMWKFRSMRVDAEKLGGQLTRAGDPRVTRVGAVLRRFKLDELPQLINVLAGDLSLVGPRPEVPRYVAKYTPEQARVLTLVPGITDPASLTFIDEERILAASQDPEREYIESLMPEKIRMNLEYAARANVLSDLGIILKTLTRIVSR